MRSSIMAGVGGMVAATAVLAGCSSTGNNEIAAHDTTVEYYRVFDIKTTAAADAVVRAASTGISRNVKDAVVATPAAAPVTDQPGRFRMADAASAPPGTPVDKGPSCDGASWTAKAAPQVRGGDNMNLVACLFPYKTGYHLDMYAVFTKPEGGWLAWPRRVGGMMMGTPEKFTETTMMDLVRAIREGTGATVSLVEARPDLAGTAWLQSGPNAPLGKAPLYASSSSAAPAAPVAAAPAAGMADPATAVVTHPVAAPGEPAAAPAAASVPAAAAAAPAPAPAAPAPSVAATPPPPALPTSAATPSAPAVPAPAPVAAPRAGSAAQTVAPQASTATGAAR
ncbi:hypothetical protein [Massilia forsythiae]|uniref:hypothetical protein n=1 Tax=Massilia forsythiae TaxID=2728020 RepID=UPI001B7D128D|nr:hypothetical protein [Massilia forsythiae]